MADEKLTQKTQTTTLQNDDLWMVVTDNATVPETKTITWTNIKATLKTYLDTLYRPVSEVDGWISAGETWTYASSTSFTVPTDLTAKYTAGVKIKLTNNTVKYFYVISSSYSAPNTTVTITGGSDYTLANTTISANYYSRASTPIGFPTYFNFTPSSVAGYSGTITTVGTCTGKFSIVGKIAFIWAQIAITTNGTGASAVRFNVPFNIVADTTLSGRNHNTGISLVVTTATPNTVVIFTYAGAYPGGDGALLDLSGMALLA